MKKELVLNNINTHKLKIEKVEKQVYALDVLSIIKFVNNTPKDVELRASYTIKDVWSKYSYYLIKVLLRMKQCLESLEYILNTYTNNPSFKDAEGKIYIPLNNDCFSLFYNFEDMIISFPRLYEGLYVNDLVHYLSTGGKKEFKNNLPNSKDADGLYWRVNLLRNRSAHSDGGFYNTDEKDVANERFIDISSKAYMLIYDSEEISIESTLIDLDKNPIVKNIIRNEVAKNKHIKLNDLLFSNKYNPDKTDVYLQYPIFGKFDYCDSLFSLSNSMLDFIESELLVFIKEIDISKINNFENIGFLYNNENIKLKDIYDINSRQWL